MNSSSCSINSTIGFAQFIAQETTCHLASEVRWIFAALVMFIFLQAIIIATLSLACCCLYRLYNRMGNKKLSKKVVQCSNEREFDITIDKSKFKETDSKHSTQLMSACGETDKQTERMSIEYIGEYEALEVAKSSTEQLQQQAEPSNQVSTSIHPGTGGHHNTMVHFKTNAPVYENITFRGHQTRENCVHETTALDGIEQEVEGEEEGEEYEFVITTQRKYQPSHLALKHQQMDAACDEGYIPVSRGPSHAATLSVSHLRRGVGIDDKTYM